MAGRTRERSQQYQPTGSSKATTSPDGETINDIITMAKKRTKRIKVSSSSLERSVDLLCKEVLECKNETRALKQELTRVSGLKQELKGKFMLPPF